MTCSTAMFSVAVPAANTVEQVVCAECMWKHLRMQTHQEQTCFNPLHVRMSAKSLQC